MGQPPVVVVRVAVAHGLACGLELFGVGALAQLGHGGGGDDLLAVELTALAQRFAQAAQVAQRGADADAGGLGAVGVGEDIGVLLGADGGPDALGHQRGKALAGDALQYPADDLGVDRLVRKALAVLALFLHGGQVVEQSLGAGVAGGCGHQAGGDEVLEDARGGVGEVLGVFDAGGHVQRLLHGGVGPGAAGQLGQVAGDGGGGVDEAFVDQLGGQQAGERLAHGPQHMGYMRLVADVVALVHHAALVQHQQAVGVGGLLPGGQGGLAALVVDEGQGFELARLGQQLAGRAGATPDAGGGPQLAQVVQGPAGVGVLEDVGQAHHLVGRGRKALHELQGHGVGGLGRRQRRLRVAGLGQGEKGRGNG